MRGSKFERLNKAIIELVESFGLVGFETLAVEDKKSMMHLLQMIDRAGGYAFGGAEGANDTVWQVAMREGVTTMDVKDVQERWLDAKDAYDQKERREWEEQAKIRDEAEKAKASNGGSSAGPDDGFLENMALPQDSSVKVVRKNR
jgi:hypothetical protein